jgi:hypothetical protein
MLNLRYGKLHTLPEMYSITLTTQKNICAM